jgi:hypothetical protein
MPAAMDRSIIPTAARNGGTKLRIVISFQDPKTEIDPRTGSLVFRY